VTIRFSGDVAAKKRAVLVKLYALKGIPALEDPVLDAAREFKNAIQVLDALFLDVGNPVEEISPEMVAASSQAEQAEIKLINATPVTIEGAIAKVQYLIRHVEETMGAMSEADEHIIIDVARTLVAGLENIARRA